MHKIWDIVLLNFNPSKGKEIKKTRPAIVLSNEIINWNSPFIIVAPITSNTSTLLYTHILISKKYKFFDTKSKIILEQVKPMDKWRFIKKIWEMSENDIEAIKKRLKFCFDI